MPTSRELVEAQAFVRRRLAAVLVGGIADGADPGPTRGVRSLVGSAVLACLLVVGAAVVGRLLPGQLPGWDSSPGLVVALETGQPFVVVTGGGTVVHPVTNVVSARLVLRGPVEPVVVPLAEIGRARLGDTLGIEQAPAALPAADLLIDGGWTACTGPASGVRMTLRDASGVVPAGSGAVVVRAGVGFHLVAASAPADDVDAPALRFALPRDPATRDTLLRELDLPESHAARHVDGAWLRLFPPGPPLSRSAFGLRDQARPPPYASETPSLEGSHLAVGDVAVSGDESFLITRAGPVTLTPFARAVYRGLSGRPERYVGSLRLASVEPVFPGRWPTGALRPLRGEVCGVLEPDGHRHSTVRLVEHPDADASAARLPSGSRRVDVQPGRGAHVVVAEGPRTTTYVIDDTGTRYRLIGEAGAYLGYGDHPPAAVPETWLRLLAEGTPLSRTAALRPSG